MRNCSWGIVLSLYNLTCFAQKPPINSETFEKWTSISSPKISNNGTYALYTIQNHPIYKRALVVLDTKNNWKLEVPGASSGSFTSDSKYAVFKNDKESLGIIKTSNKIIHYIPFVRSFALSLDGNAKWLVYQLNSSQKTLRIHNLESGKERTFDFVQEYLLSRDGNTLLFLAEEKEDQVNQTLHWLNLTSGDITTIWQGARAGNFVFGWRNNQVAFAVEESLNNQTEKKFWYYKAGTDKAIELATNKTIGNDSTLTLDKIGLFSKDDSCLFITLKQKGAAKLPPSPLVVWSYADTILQSKRLNETLHPRTQYKAVINIQNAHLIRLERENETFILPTSSESTNHWGFILNTQGDGAERYWNANSVVSVFLISTRDGSRKKIDGLNNSMGDISPNGKYVVYYDAKQNNYVSYETESGVTRNITQSIPVIWQGYSKDYPISGYSARGVAGWKKNDEAVLVYDEHDIWLIDLAGKTQPVNITNGYGKKHTIRFSLDLRGDKIFSNNDRIIINAFNLKKKDNGFYSKTLNKPGNPELLSIQPYLYKIPDNPSVSMGFTPLKASRAEVYLVQRMKANEAPNIFSTSDFKTFTALSDVQPQKKYNWLTSELINWKGLDGDSLQGILYKPENFDPLKKYPVIFHYNDKKSDGLHAFLKPGILEGGMNVNMPYYVSNGYLVFLPDIHFKIGEIGESVINSVVSAAEYLSKMPWVNSKKMGIQSGSFGGYETNYLVTHSNIFAAACSAAGLSDLVSAYGFVNAGGSSKQVEVESTLYRMGFTLWQRPDLYIKNSPIFSADKVTTPLLIMHTKQDGVCAFADALEFFTALRRLNKKVWMLQYEGNHGVYGISAIDFSTRMQQFFDHYLKDAPPPKWMIQGIPAELKGIATGLEITQ